jgi:hypothetical protein
MLVFLFFYMTTVDHQSCMTAVDHTWTRELILFILHVSVFILDTMCCYFPSVSSNIDREKNMFT